ncbi:MAG: NFACT RNA binding domain-containing protein [Acidobacteriota bacterium]
MHAELLSGLTAEAARRVVGKTIATVLCRPGHGLALLFSGSRDLALDVAPGPPRPRFAATSLRLRAVSGPHDPVVGQLRPALLGRTVRRLRLLDGERIVRVDIGDDLRLILEVLGGGSNLFWTDADGRIAGRLRKAGRPGGGLGPGRIWQPPTSASGQARPAGRWVGVADDVASRPGLGGGRVGARPEDREPDEVRVRLHGPEEDDAAFWPFSSLGDAFLRREFLLERHEARRDRRLRLASRLKAAAGRLNRLARAVEREQQASRSAPRLRHEAEAILAGLRVARRDGDRLIVPDPYDVSGALLTVSIDPAASDAENARRRFRRAARMERCRVAAANKRRDVESKQKQIAELDLSFQEAQDDADLDRIADDLERLVPVRRTSPRPSRRQDRRPRRGKRTLDPRERRIRRYPLADGWEILVGADGRVNDYLTFKIARPHDFWLHAADYPGAHVVVPNAARRAELPEGILRRAAAIAAHFSKAPAGVDAVVRWTQVKHVRKGRGLPAGAVLLPSSPTVRVRAEPPARRDGAT